MNFDHSTSSREKSKAHGITKKQLKLCSNMVSSSQKYREMRKENEKKKKSNTTILRVYNNIRVRHSVGGRPRIIDVYVWRKI